MPYPIGASCKYPDAETLPTAAPSDPTAGSSSGMFTSLSTAPSTNRPLATPGESSFQANIYTSSAPSSLTQPVSQTVGQPQYYQDHNGSYTGASSSTFRPNKRARTGRSLTAEETAFFTRTYQRGDFYVVSLALPWIVYSTLIDVECAGF